jgi:hypothetical protein
VGPSRSRSRSRERESLGYAPNNPNGYEIMLLCNYHLYFLNEFVFTRGRAVFYSSSIENFYIENC